MRLFKAKHTDGLVAPCCGHLVHLLFGSSQNLTKEPHQYEHTMYNFNLYTEPACR